MHPLRFAIVGAGNIGKLHAHAVNAIDDACVTVVCDRNAVAGQALARAHGAVWVADYRHAVERQDVDVVCVCTPSGAHAEIAEAAAHAGKHLAVEKPIDITLERADRIIRAAHQASVKMACIFPTRFRQGPWAARKAIAEGRLGRLTLADAYVKWYRSQEYYAGTWRGTWALDGGGALINQSIHSIDLLQWLAGPVDTVFGHTAVLAHDIETEDTASAVLRFRNGALGVIQGSTACWPGERTRVELHGDRGTIVLQEGCITAWKLADASPDEEARMLALEAAQGSGAADPLGITYELHRRQLAELIAAIRNGRPLSIAGAEGRKALEIILAIYQSARSGQVVRLPLA